MTRVPTGPERGLIIAIVLVGIVGRVLGYLSAGSLWLDELFIANNLRELSFIELAGPLRYGQNAPLGWLWLQKAVITFGGESEYALRASSLVASIATLPLCAWLAVRCAGWRFAWMPVALVSFSPFVVWQGLQAKQYAMDLFVATLLTVTAYRTLDQRRSPISLGAMGTIGLFVSMPAIFVLAGVGLSGFVLDWRRGGLLRRTWIGVGALWLGAFAVNYFAFLRPRSQAAWLYEYWAPGLFAWPIDSIDDLTWAPRVLSSALANPGGIWFASQLAAGLLLLGFTVGRGSGVGRALLGIPIACALAAALAGVYPFTIRLVLFLVPAFGVGIALGADRIARFGLLARGLVTVAAALLTLAPTVFFARWLANPGLPLASETAPTIRELERRREPSDAVRIDHYLTHAWRFYGRSPMPQALEEAWQPADRPIVLARALTEIDANRVWIVLSRVVDAPPPSSIGAGLDQDIAQRRWSLSQTYRAWLDDHTEWARLEPMRAAVTDNGWRIEAEHSEYGCRLWLLTR